MLDHMSKLGLSESETGISVSEVSAATNRDIATQTVPVSMEVFSGSQNDRLEMNMLENLIVALNKCDLLDGVEQSLLPHSGEVAVSVCPLSCSTMEGMDDFVALLSDHVKKL